ncbi:uncharacterized protein LOC134822702 isoform X1 [Bolinopsis microptera]|uniref:uncharacterized protein LOC134822702 isoform X1 n=1 Tax=Bolinopsis microptera TaxID=2820187 RepID=UPI00307A1CFD
MELFGKKRKKKIKKDSSSNEGGNLSPTQKLRFNNKGQTIVRPATDESPTNLYEPERPPVSQNSPPSSLRFEHKSGATIRFRDNSNKQLDSKDKRKKVAKRRSQLGTTKSLTRTANAMMGTEGNGYGMEPLIINIDPNHLKPQSFKVGYLYKREGNDYKTKRHFRLSTEGGLRIYKNEQDKATSPIGDICLDFMRCELQAGVPDITNKDPRYFFCLKSDDLSAKAWFLAAESEYERKKWMVSLGWHIDNHCKPSVTDVNVQTKEYLGYQNSDEQENECNTSSSNSDYDSDSDDVYQPGIQRSLRLVPQIAEPDDDIYGEFDPGLTISQYEMAETASAMKVMSLHEPRRGSLDRKASTTHNIIPDLESRKSVNPIITEEEEDDTYMAAGDVGGSSTLSVQMSLGGEPIMFPPQAADDDDTYMDGFSLKMSSSAPLEAPALPASRPPSFLESDKHYLPPMGSHSVSVDRGESASTMPLYHNLRIDEVFSDEENLYIDHDEFASCTIKDDDIYAAPPTLRVDVQQNFVPPFPLRVPQNVALAPLPPRNLPPRRPS